MDVSKILESRNLPAAEGLKHRLTLLASFLVLVLPGIRAFAQAPPVVWSKVIASRNNSNATFTTCTAVDRNANVFFADAFNIPALTVGSQTLTNLSASAGPDDVAGLTDAFVAKYDSAGNFLWVRQISGDHQDVIAGAATDPAGNVLVLVNSNSTNIVSGTNVLATNLQATGTSCIVLAKFDTQGNFLWARQALGSHYVDGTSVAADANGNILFAGNYDSTNLIFGTNSLSKTNSATYADFFAKYDGSGNLLLTRQVNVNNAPAPAATMDGQGNIFMFDTTAGIADYGTIQVTNFSYETTSLAKFDPAGNVLWAREAAHSSIFIWSNRAVVDAQGNCYLTGGDLGAVFQNIILPVVGSQENAFVAKYDGSGNLIWANAIAGDVMEYGGGVAVDAAGNCYASGATYSTNLNVGGIALANPYTNVDYWAGYAAKFDAIGDVLWAQVIPFQGDDAVDAHGNMYCSGVVQAPTNGNWYTTFLAEKISGPVVTIQPSGSQLVISWPTNADGLNLESTTDLSIGTWSPVTNIPSVLGSQFTVTNATTDPIRYYRLRNF